MSTSSVFAQEGRHICDPTDLPVFNNIVELEDYALREAAQRRDFNRNVIRGVMGDFWDLELIERFYELNRGDRMIFRYRPGIGCRTSEFNGAIELWCGRDTRSPYHGGLMRVNVVYREHPICGISIAYSVTQWSY